MTFWGRPPGDIPQNLGQQIPDQDQNLAPAMLPGVPARECQPDNMIENAVQENHEEVELDQLQPLQGMMDGEDEDMPQIHNQHPSDVLAFKVPSFIAATNGVPSYTRSILSREDKSKSSSLSIPLDDRPGGKVP